MQNTTEILDIQNVSKSYGKNTALQDVNFSISAGKIVGLLGPNGSGKTTLIKIIMGLLSDYTGTAHINGESPSSATNAVISYLPDKFHIPSWLTVRQSVKLFADFYTDFESDRANNMLEAMKIPLNKKIKSLSRGMREKAGLSLVMSRRAKLFVLDEPIGAVDPAGRDFIIETILGNFSRESAILLSTHIIADIEPILDTAIFIKDGVIVLNEEVDKIRQEQNTSLDQLFREMFAHTYARLPEDRTGEN
ncbi:MAG: ABC transporter ATP-binding protein [Firmicutes bacterium]|nr:ABC transporter ATP-binding protein [Bacillota bacterium]